MVDAIDTVSGKLALVEEAYQKGIPIISSMGAGNKLDPTCFQVADLFDTSAVSYTHLDVYKRQGLYSGEDNSTVSERVLGRNSLPSSNVTSPVSKSFI